MPSLDFKGKQFVYTHHLSVPFRQLEIDPKKSHADKGKKPSADDNLIIHGDNLHALKALLPSYGGKIQCIYIDPPYNTGNEGWCYNDNVKGPLIQEWLKESANPVDKEDLERHDKWLCMMWPRLKLLYELLSDDGAIFVSIDNNEQHHLRLMMDEIFGPDKFVTCIANINNPKGRSDDAYFPTAHEYILVYCKKDFILGGWKPEEKVIKRYRKTDKDGKKYREIDLRKTGDEDRREDREDMFYYFYFNKKTKDFFPSYESLNKKGYVKITPLKSDGQEGRWRWGLETSKTNIDCLVPKMMPQRGIWGVFEMDYLEEEERIKPTTAWTAKAFNSERGTEQFLDLGFQKEDFPRPKPVGLIKAILEIATDRNSIILDSFAGSGTTGQAVVDLNHQDGGHRKFILVECEDYADRITAERLRRVIRGVPQAKDERLTKGLGGSFTLCTLGDDINIETLLKGQNLPDYQTLAKYVFYTATGQTLSKVPKPSSNFFIGETENYRIHLVYRPDKQFLRSAKSSLNSELVELIAKGKKKGKKSLVFATAKFMGQKELSEKGLEFCQLPYAVHRILGD